MVPPDSTGISRVPAYSGTSTNFNQHFTYGTLTLSGTPFQALSAMLLEPLCGRPTTPPCLTTDGLGCSLFARRYSENLTFDLFSSGYLDVSVPRVSFQNKLNDRV